jgi:hypothetical protein
VINSVIPTSSTYAFMNAVQNPQPPQYLYSQILQIAGCPCSVPAPFGSSSYRAVHANLEHPNNFLPKAILEPHLLKGAVGSKQCGLWGLSMYDNPDSLRTMIARVERTVKNFRKKIGDHCAELTLNAAHGTRTPSNSQNHFDFYGYKTCDYHAQVVSVQQL